MAYCSLKAWLIQFQMTFQTRKNKKMPRVKSSRSKYSRANPNSSKKPLILIIGGAMLLLVAVFFAFARQPQPTIDVAGGTPKIKADKEFVDLGDQKLGNTVQVSFTISNEGDGTLRLTKEPYVEVKEGC